MTGISRLGLVLTCVGLAATLSCGRGGPQKFATPEEAVAALDKAAQLDTIQGLETLFGSESKALVERSDPATARRNRQVFVVAMGEGWHLTDDTNGRKVLVVGNESWPFPVPLVPDGGQWRFDVAAGAEEVIGRRIGRNELAVIRSCGTYVAAQRVYAARGHDGRPPGRYAKAFRSDPGRQNGLYWPASHGEKLSPLGDLVAEAAQEGLSPNTRREGLNTSRPGPSPFHGYYFTILTAQGASAPGGTLDYVADGEMTGGFALVAWPAEYGVTGIMTFLVGADGVVRQKDLGEETFKLAGALKRYDPDATWMSAN